MPKIQKDARHPAHEMMSTTSGGVTAPPRRLPRNTTPCAVPHSCAGNHRAKLLDMLGYAPASPAPNRKRAVASDAKFHVIPVAIVKADHQSTMRIRTLRGPNRSPSQPLGISKRA
jgi:hypothetical protein